MNEYICLEEYRAFCCIMNLTKTKVTGCNPFYYIMNEEEILETVSMLEQDIDADLQEFKEAILDGTLSDEYNITEKQLEKLKAEGTEVIIEKILDSMFTDGKLAELKVVNEDSQCKMELYGQFQKLYEQYLGRELCDGER